MAKTTEVRPTQTMQGSHTAWSPEENPAVAELLDHIAEMLAVEYVRLMEKAAQDAGSEG